jgi:hypothetical protein
MIRSIDFEFRGRPGRPEWFFSAHSCNSRASSARDSASSPLSPRLLNSLMSSGFIVGRPRLRITSLLRQKLGSFHPSCFAQNSMSHWRSTFSSGSGSSSSGVSGGMWSLPSKRRGMFTTASRNSRSITVTGTSASGAHISAISRSDSIRTALSEKRAIGAIISQLLHSCSYVGGGVSAAGIGK